MPDSISLPHEKVFLLHGIGANRWMMHTLASRLRKAGYDVMNWGYPSILGTIEDHSQRLANELKVAEEDPQIDAVHIVAHSMGSIVTRHALALYRPQKLRRVVLLGPPNRGSPWASVFGPWLRPLCRPLDQLAARNGSFVNELGPLQDVEFGVIAAGRDLLVPLASTHLEGQRDHRVVPCAHSMLLFREDVAVLIRSFLAHGHFSPQATTAACG